MPTFDAGTIDATLNLDRSRFTKGLQEARAQKKRFEERDFSVELLLDRTSWNKDLALARKQRDRVDGTKISVEMELVRANFTRQIAAARAQIKRLDGSTVEIGLKAKGFGKVSSLAAQVLALTTGTKTVNIDVDTTAAIASLAAFGAVLDVALQDRTVHIDIDTSGAIAKTGALKRAVAQAAKAISKTQAAVPEAVVPSSAGGPGSHGLPGRFGGGGPGSRAFPRQMSGGGGDHNIPNRFGTGGPGSHSFARQFAGGTSSNGPGSHNFARQFGGGSAAPSRSAASRLGAPFEFDFDSTSNSTPGSRSPGDWMGEARTGLMHGPDRPGETRSPISGRVIRESFGDVEAQLAEADRREEELAAERKKAAERRRTSRRPDNPAAGYGGVNVAKRFGGQGPDTPNNRGFGDGDAGDDYDGNGSNRGSTSSRQRKPRPAGRASGNGGSRAAAPRGGGGGRALGGGATALGGGGGGGRGQLVQGQLLQSRAMISGIAALLPILTSAIGVAGGAIGGLASGLTAAAGAGVIGIGALIGAAVRAKDVLGEQEAAQSAVTDAEAALAAASTNEERAAAAADLAAALVALKDASDKVTPSMQAYASSQDRMKESWEGFVTLTQDRSFMVMGGAFDLVAENLERFAPVANLVLGVFQGALADIGAWFDGPEGQAMLTFFGTTGISALESFLGVGGNLLVFFGRLFDAFSPLAIEMMDGLEGITAGWADWAGSLKGSEDFITFLDWVRERGAQVLSFLGSMWDAIVNIGVALDPIAEVLMNVFGAIFDWIGGLDPGILGAFAAGIIAAAVAFGVMGAAIALVNVVMAANPITLIVMAIAALVAGLIYAYNHIDGFRTVVDAVWAAIKTGAMWIWEVVLKPFFAWLGDAFTAAGKVLSFVWESIIKPVFEGLAAVASWLWNSVVMPVFNALKNGFDLMAAALSFAYNNIIKPVFELLGAIVSTAWNTFIKPAIDAFKAGWDLVAAAVQYAYVTWIEPAVTAVGNGIRDMWNTYVSPALAAVKSGWDTMSTALKTVYDTIIQPVIDGFKTLIGTISGAFETAVTAVGAAWDKISNIVKAPIKWVVETVINNGLIAGFNKVADFFGTSKIADLTLPAGFDSPPSSSATPKGTGAVAMATGGRVPGYSPSATADNIPAMLTAGEFVQPVGVVQHYGQGFMESLRRKEIPKYANGGIVKNISNAVSNVVETVSDVAGGVVDFMSDPTGFLTGQVEGLLEGHGFAGEAVKTVTAVPTKLLGMAVDAVKGWFTNNDSGAGAMTGGGDIPVSGTWTTPSVGRVSSQFGPRWGTHHNGVDVAGGGPTYAASAGRVSRVGWNVSPAGNTGIGIMVDHGAGTSTYYGHNPVGGPRVKVGDVVPAGKHIGYQGNTGNSTGVHLHYGVFQGNSAINPTPFMSARGVSIGVRDQGGPLYPGWNMMYNGTGENEMVFTSNQTRQASADMEEMRQLVLAATQSRGPAPLIGGDLVLQAHKDEDPTSQFERVLFQLQTQEVSG